MSDGLVKILDGNTFVVSDSRGDIEASLTDPTGLFSYDTRFLSKWVLTVNGERLNALSVDDLQYFETRFFLVPGTGTVYIDAKLSVMRRRAVVNGFEEELTILNHDDKPVDLTVRVEAGSDFADLFEVKDALKKKGTYSARATKGRLELAYTRDTYKRTTTISATTPAKVDKDGLTFKVRLDPHGAWSTTLNVEAVLPAVARRSRPIMQRELEKWLAGAPRLECDWDELKTTYRRSLVDLAALRFSPPVAGGKSLPAAGLPWFMTMFGRDSIFTSLQALPFTPELAETTLRVLGEWQGSGVDDFRDEDPGRILARDALRRDDRVRGAAAFALLRLRRRDAALRRAAGRVRALDRRPEARARARARGARGAQLDRRVRRPARQRLRLVPAPQREDGPREPVLEGLLGLDLLPRRQAARLPARDLRAPGLRLRRQDARRPPGASRLEGRELREAAGEGGRRSQAPLQPRLLGREGRVLRPRARHGGQAGRLAHLEQRPPALERDRRQVQGEGRRGPSARTQALLRLGRAHARRGRGPLQPDRLPRRHRLAVRQLVHRLGPAALRLQGGGGRDRRPGSSTRPSSSTGGCPRPSAATTGR